MKRREAKLPLVVLNGSHDLIDDLSFNTVSPPLVLTDMSHQGAWRDDVEHNLWHIVQYLTSKNSVSGVMASRKSLQP